MHISIVYSNKVSFRHLKKKSKKFFAGTEYSHRNGVFVHRQKDSFFRLIKIQFAYMCQTTIQPPKVSLTNFYQPYLTRLSLESAE